MARFTQMLGLVWAAALLCTALIATPAAAQNPFAVVVRVDDGVVTILNAESNPGECEISAGETLLEAME